MVNIARQAEDAVSSQSSVVEDTTNSFKQIDQLVAQLIQALQTISNNVQEMNGARNETLSAIESISDASTQTAECSSSVHSAAGTQLDAIKNLDDRQFKKAVLVLTSGMNIFLFISFVWPTGLNLREGIVYDLHTLSGNLLKFVQTVDTPKSVFPSMHVYVTLVLQYTLEMQKKLVPSWGIWVGRVLAVLIVLSTMFTKQHSVLDVSAAIVMFAVLVVVVEKIVKK